MKIISLLRAGFGATLLSLAASLPLFAADATAPIDPETKALLDLIVPSRRSAALGGVSRSESMRATDQAALKLRDLALPWLKTHPAGVDRAHVVLALNDRCPQFIKEIKPGYDEKPAADLIVYDTAAREAWTAELATLLGSVVNDPTAEPAQRTQARRVAIRAMMQSADTTAKVVALHADLEAMAAEPGGGESAAQLFKSFLYAAAGIGLKDFEQYLGNVAEGKQPELAAAAKTALETLARQKAGISKLKFTAADGREVDINALRGKVVLIDFWATWCGPCVKEIPNVIAAYEKYHARDFEIIGVSFDSAGLVDADSNEQLQKHRDQSIKANPQRVAFTTPLPARDTPEAAAGKLAKAKKKLLDFTVEHGMTWPQHFDGKYWQNEFGKLFGISGLPAMFLIDKEGNLVSTNARGEKLEPAIKALLGVKS
jgi:thiol-disulfide isomerase/thioredoxin